MWLSGRVLFQHIYSQGFLPQLHKKIWKKQKVRETVLLTGSSPASFVIVLLFLVEEEQPLGLERGLEGTPGMEERPENQRCSEEGLSHEIKRELVTHERVAEES